MIDTIVKPRGRTSIELKFRFVLPDHHPRRSENYRVDVHLFIPSAFSVDPETYTSERFYEDATIYVRFNTPGFSPEHLLDHTSGDSPLARLERMIEDSADERSRAKWFVYESKLLGAVFKTLLRGSFGGMGVVKPAAELLDGEEPIGDDDDEDDSLGDSSGGGAEPDFDVRLRVKSLHEVCKRFHRICRSVNAQENLADLHQHCRMIDEHMSLLIEKYFAAYVNHYDLAQSDPSLYALMSKVIIHEADYRSEQGYPTVLPGVHDEQELEQYVYRLKMLKKYASEVLFFRVRTTNEARRIEHVLYAIAAGIAMVFATLIAFFGQTVFGGISLSLFLLLVAAYMLKDRMKDFFRDFFRRSLGRRFYDRREHLYDSIWKKKLATLRERVGFVRPGDEDQTILDLRARGPFETQLTQTESESHMMYRKDVKVRASTLRETHSRIRGLADITILNLSHLFQNLTVQTASIPVVVGKKAVEVISTKRVYHLNIIVCHRSSSRETRERFRLVVDRKGIKRIDAVGRIEV